ncbi:unnamed protein product [Lactuca virosa]|uniref:Uncharacterized protein n=1 Tax=Lactuca virosa TaxID=75947 RepID=A0AAU9NTK2_9ASTR|nr:unnamed protein product [Lactuca virosa]
MPSLEPAEHSWSPNYRRHMEENHFNGVTNEDMPINLLQTQLELSFIREDFQGSCVKMVLEHTKRKKMKYFLGIVGVATVVIDFVSGDACCLLLVIVCVAGA